MNRQTMPQAEFARLCGVSKPAVAKWIRTGVASLAENKEVHLAATAASMRDFRRAGIPPGFDALMNGEASATADAPNASGRPKRLIASRQKGTEHRRADLVERLRALDWKTPFDECVEGLERVQHAAAAVGFEVAESDIDDDGHWGGYQLRSIDLLHALGGLDRDAVVAGFGFELDACDALLHCREALLPPDYGPGDEDDVFVIDLELLPALAFPFGPTHRPNA